MSHLLGDLEQYRRFICVVRSYSIAKGYLRFSGVCRPQSRSDLSFKTFYGFSFAHPQVSVIRSWNIFLRLSSVQVPGRLYFSAF